MNRKQREERFHTVLLEMKDIGVIVQNPDVDDLFGLSKTFKQHILDDFKIQGYEDIDHHQIIKVLVRHFHVYDAKACAEYTRILVEMFTIEKEVFERSEQNPANYLSDEFKEKFK